MPHSNGKITAPISVDDVKYTIGTSSDDVGTLCISPAVNPFSKYKPVRLPSLLGSLEPGYFQNRGYPYKRSL